MTKDQNTYAKRQREVEKKRKAEEKRVRRAKKKHAAEKLSESSDSQSLMASGELSILSVFRNYKMTPGKMLCLNSSELEAFKIQLAQLTKEGLLVAEKYQGGYSLTEIGFAEMNSGK